MHRVNQSGVHVSQQQNNASREGRRSAELDAMLNPPYLLLDALLEECNPVVHGVRKIAQISPHIEGALRHHIDGDAELLNTLVVHIQRGSKTSVEVAGAVGIVQPTLQKKRVAVLTGCIPSGRDRASSGSASEERQCPAC